MVPIELQRKISNSVEYPFSFFGCITKSLAGSQFTGDPFWTPGSHLKEKKENTIIFTGTIIHSGLLQLPTVLTNVWKKCLKIRKYNRLFVIAYTEVDYENEWLLLGRGEAVNWKNQRWKTLWDCPFNVILSFVGEGTGHFGIFIKRAWLGIFHRPGVHPYYCKAY